MMISSLESTVSMQTEEEGSKSGHMSLNRRIKSLRTKHGKLLLPELEVVHSDTPYKAMPVFCTSP